MQWGRRKDGVLQWTSIQPFNLFPLKFSYHFLQIFLLRQEKLSVMEAENSRSKGLGKEFEGNGGQKLSSSSEHHINNNGLQFTSTKPDSFVVDMERFEKDINSNSRITVCNFSILIFIFIFILHSSLATKCQLNRPTLLKFASY